MSVREKELPFDMEENLYDKDYLEPGYYDRILDKKNMVKDVTPFQIKTSIHNCFACSKRHYKKPLELSNFDASIMVIGETPSDVDFQTKEGKLLADTLKWARYDLDDIYFTSLIKCEDSPTPERCQMHLISEILCVQPKMIVALGYDVGKHFDQQAMQPGFFSKIMDQYEMITTYRTVYTMTEQHLFEDFCNHMLRAKQQANI